MATFNGGRMVALLLCVLFAPNVSFAQDDNWETVVVYMVDPIDEQLAPEVLEYIDNLNFCDFTPAREGQMAQVARENAARIQAAEDYLREDRGSRGDGTSSWYPSWIPLAFARTTEDSLFKNILNIEAARYVDRPGRQTLREFFEMDGAEPAGLNADGTQRFRYCSRNCRRELYPLFRFLVEIHDESQYSATAPRIISFTIQARYSPFVEQLNENDTPEPEEEPDTPEPPEESDTPEPPEEPGTSTGIVEFRWDSIRLLQPAAMDPNPYVIDTPLYWQPAAKPVASTETSSWGRIKATFAD